MSKSSPFIVIWWPMAHEQSLVEQEGKLPLIRYCVLSDSGQIINKGQELLNKLPTDMPCLVLLHPAESTLISVTPPPISGKKLRDSLPFLVEPYLLNDPEENFLGYWRDLLHAQDKALVSVVKKTRIREIIAACNQYQLKVNAISSEMLISPTEPTARASGDMLILADKLSPPVAIGLNQTQLTRAIVHRRSKALGDAGSQNQRFAISKHDLQLISGWANDDYFSTSDPVSSDLLLLIKRPLCSQDELKRMGLKINHNDANGTRTLLRPLALLTIVAVAGLNGLAFKAQQQEKSLRADIESAYKKVLPDTPMVADPLLLIERAKRQLNQGTQATNTDGLAYLFHEVALSLDGAPFNSLVSLDWKNQQLKLTFNPNVTQGIQEEALSKLKSKPIEANWIVGTENINPVLQARWSKR